MTEDDHSLRIKAIYPYEYEYRPFLIWLVQERAHPEATPSDIAANLHDWVLNYLGEDTDMDVFTRFCRYFVDELKEGKLDPLAEKRQQFRQDNDRSLIDQLIHQTNLYTTSKSFTDLLAFVARMRGFAPFNAMLLHAQKPGITHAATAADWLARFNRRPKQDARPLIVMQAMGPVGFVFDMLDTEGDDLPPEAFAFPTLGDLSLARWHEMLKAVARAKIEILWVDKGDGAAGSMTRTQVVVKGKTRAHWTVRMNQNHDPQTQFVTLAHELAHMFLGHLGGDETQSIKARRGLVHDLEEVEAEAVAWVVAHRNGLKPRSEAYLDRYKAAFKGLEVGTILKAANAVETAMGISAAQLAKAGRLK
ncbi:MAG: ImmA/IrrE family metallo-endopeptidase [Paracoccaceae bacterium]|nr:ImmA/IrrE family metallo-endopeptidase [Paracoccaceae bacterium]